MYFSISLNSVVHKRPISVLLFGHQLDYLVLFPAYLLWWIWTKCKMSICISSLYVRSPGFLTGKWLLFERLSLQSYNPPPTPLSKGPRLRLYLSCQPHSPHTYCTNKQKRIHTHTVITVKAGCSQVVPQSFQMDYFEKIQFKFNLTNIMPNH